jgi:ferritin-like metal-binding protein YciE
MTQYTNQPRGSGANPSAADRIAGQAQDALDQARDTAGRIAGDVRDTAQGFDLNEQVAQRPWLLLGAAVATGYVLGNMGGGSRQEYRYGSAAQPSGQSYVTYGRDIPAYAIEQARRYESDQREGMVGKVGRKFFGSLGSLEDLFHEQLADLYDAEHQILKALPKMIAAASSPELKQSFETHLRQTQGQIQRLQQIFGQIGAKPQGKTCAAMQGLVAEGEELMSMRADPTVMDAGLIAAAQRVEHYEIAGYGCLRTWARQLGYNQAVQALQQTLDEEEQTDKRLTQIAERAVNVKAAQS